MKLNYYLNTYGVGIQSQTPRLEGSDLEVQVLSPTLGLEVEATYDVESKEMFVSKINIEPRDLDIETVMNHLNSCRRGLTKQPHPWNDNYLDYEAGIQVAAMCCES